MNSEFIINKYLSVVSTVRFLCKIIYTILKKILKKLDLIEIYNLSLIQRKVLKVVDIKSWSHNHHSQISFIDINRKMYVSSPDIISSDNKSYQFVSGEAELPEIYLAKLQDVIVIEGSDLVIADNNSALYDEIALDKENRYGLRIGMVPLIKNRNIESGKVLLEYQKNLKKLPKQAIHFCKDYSYNYFHWLIECLPRMWIIEQFSELDSLPLLVDSQLHNQQLESLELITQNQREFIRLQPGQGYAIDNLIYPSSLSYMHNNYDHPIAYEKDVLISPIAIQYLRNKFLSIINMEENGESGHSKKIFLSRKKLGGQGRLLNTEEIETMLADEGFDIIYPELLSFKDQVRIFSRAEVIVGAAGSALANIVFVPANCKVFVLSTNNRFNPYLFNMIASSVNCKLCHVIGEEQITKLDCGSVHNAFKINTNIIKSAFDAYH